MFDQPYYVYIEKIHDMETIYMPQKELVDDHTSTDIDSAPISSYLIQTNDEYIIATGRTQLIKSGVRITLPPKIYGFIEIYSGFVIKFLPIDTKYDMKPIIFYPNEEVDIEINVNNTLDIDIIVPKGEIVMRLVFLCQTPIEIKLK